MEARGKIEAIKEPKVLSASTLRGNKVTNSKGEDLGEVEAIMIDLARGRVAYVVLSFGLFHLLTVWWLSSLAGISASRQSRINKEEYYE